VIKIQIILYNNKQKILRLHIIVSFISFIPKSPTMTKTILPILALATLVSCSKGGSDSNHEKETQTIAITNSYYDSLYVSVQNTTNTSLSLSTQKLPPLGMTTFTAQEGDKVTIKGVVKPNKKFGRHPLFLSEVAYDSSVTIPSGRQDITYTVPASKAVQLRINVFGNPRSTYIRGTLKYGTREDSLLYVQPNEITQYTTIGYFKPSDIQDMNQPRIKLYYGTQAPYTEFEAGSVLWAKGGFDAWGNKVAEAPSPTATGYANTYQYLIQ
jgi:hypothetical protein